MNEDVLKAKVALAVNPSPETATRVASRMVELAGIVLLRKVGNDTRYAVQVFGPGPRAGDRWGWKTLREGPREWCLGFAEGFEMGKATRCRVVCGSTVIWPEENYLDEAEPPEKE